MAKYVCVFDRNKEVHTHLTHSLPSAVAAVWAPADAARCCLLQLPATHWIYRVVIFCWLPPLFTTRDHIRLTFDRYLHRQQEEDAGLQRGRAGGGREGVEVCPVWAGRDCKKKKKKKKGEYHSVTFIYKCFCAFLCVCYSTSNLGWFPDRAVHQMNKTDRFHF